LTGGRPTAASDASETISDEARRALAAKRRSFGGNFVPAPGVSILAPDPDDNRLILDALAGNAEAFGRLVLRYQDRLFHAMTCIMGSAEDARDVVQDAFVQAFIKLESFAQRSAFYTWLYRIALNVAASRRRRDRRHRSLDGEDSSDRGPPDPGAAPDDRIQQQEQAARVQAALRSLPEEYRVVLVLREIDGCDYDAIGDILGLPAGTVRSRLHRARNRMRELLKTTVEMDQD
jgi:RNA polymerase sigma-70 factor, ECF subfamily